MKNLKICKRSNGRGYCFLKEEYCVEGPCKDEELIEYAPVVRGEWIDEGNYVTTAYGSLHVYKCSHCLSDVTIDDFFDNFCSSCGADMRKAVK